MSYSFNRINNQGIIFNGDCLEVMEALINNNVRVDLICCDPPYRVIGGGCKTFKEKWKGSILENNDGKIFDYNDLNFNKWIELCYNILKDDAEFYCMSNVLNLFKIYEIAIKQGFKIHNLLAWEKNNALANKWYMKNCEYVLYFYKGKARYINNMGSKMIHQFNNILGNKLHPTEKPVDLMEFYISNSSNENDLILDPCFGSGSTLVACKNLNRKFIGIELDEKYYKIGKNRLTENQMSNISKSIF